MKTSPALCSIITFHVPGKEVQWDSLTNLKVFVYQIGIFAVMCGIQMSFPVIKKQNQLNLDVHFSQISDPRNTHRKRCFKFMKGNLK